MPRDPLSNGTVLPDSAEIQSDIQRKVNYNLMSVASLIIGIFSLFSTMELLPELTAIILGACSRKKCDQKWIATAGIVCGVITLILTIIYCLMFMQISPPSMPS